ncbi:sulfotransferase [Bizionia echini]|uniref:sulfotransferase family protein n=1 Tax=Bizionia echini TaxID=649333 RepID=UPI0030D9EB48|tara:strand:- start:105 stop:1094 length:990 start_codon:yes stop_codon:yes gene_type:complete
MAEEQCLWQSQTPEYLPDFIIGGAMKSGTTSFHAILNAHPDVAMVPDELGFFDMDDLLQHPDFNFYQAEQDIWTRQSMVTHSDLLWDWYHSKFKALGKSTKLLGEDSTSYLASRHAAERIAIQNKPIKLIFILRHPTKRTISNYLHKLKSGRAIYSLEDTLRYDPFSIVDRSLYPEQLKRFYEHIPSDRIKVVLFEDFIEDKAQCIQEVCDFLALDFKKLDSSIFNTHSNKTKIPKHIGLQLFRNRLLQNTCHYRYSKFLPIQPAFQRRLPWYFRLINRIHLMVNPHKSCYNFKASAETTRFLNDFFKTEFGGLDSLIHKEAWSKWFKD